MLTNSRSSITTTRKSGESRCCSCKSNDCCCSSSRRSNTTVGSNDAVCMNTYATRNEFRRKTTSSSCGKKPFNPFVASGSLNKRYVTLAMQPVKINPRIPLTVPVRNLDTGSKRYYKIIREDEKLYQKENITSGDEIRISRDEFDKLTKRARLFSASTSEEQRHERNCTELGYPQVNSTRKNAKELTDAIKKLENLSTQINVKVRTEEQYKKKVDNVVTKKLIIPFKTKIYKDLVQVESAEAERIKSVEEITKAFKSNLPTPKRRDDEPDILMFNKPTFCRIKPKLPCPPPPLEQELSSDVNMDFEVIGIRNRAMSEIRSNASVRP